MKIRKLHVTGVVIILAWLLSIGWLVWRERHSSDGAAAVERLNPEG